MILIFHGRIKRTYKRAPFFCFSLIETDTITGCEPKITVTILHHVMYLIVHQRPVVAEGMFYKVITLITIITDCDTCGIIGKPNTLFFIHINVIDIVSIHPIIATIISCYIGFTHGCIHIQFVYPFSTCGYQKFMSVQSYNLVNLYIIGGLTRNDFSCSNHVIYKYSLFVGSHKQLL